MIKSGVRGLGFALMLLVSGVRAELVTDMYAAQVPVADQSAAELARASRLALAEVVVKVSGRADVLRNPVIAAAVGDARSRVQQYAYLRGRGGADVLNVRLEFESAYVTALVIEAGAPLWNANRPAALVWLAAEGDAGRQFVQPGVAPEQVAVMRAEFARRGVPIQLPLYDLADAAALTPDQAWQLNGQALAAASVRYQLQDVLAGHFTPLPTGGVTGEWLYLQGGDRVLRPVQAESEELFFQEGAAIVAEAMAARYAVAATTDGGSGLAMSVSGVTDYGDYAAVISWLESLELIERADVVSIRGDTINLRLQAQADGGRLAAIIELDARFLPVPAGGSPGTQLSYQWQK